MLNNILFCNKLEKETFLHLLRLPYKFFEIRSSGDILYRMSSLTGFRELFSTQIIMGIIDIGTIGFILFFMIKKSMFLSLVVLILSMINILFLIVSRKPIAQSINNEVLEQSEMQAVENECLITISSIKTSGLEEDMYKSWMSHLEKLMKRYKERYTLNNIYNSITGTFQMFAPIVILVFGTYQYHKGAMTIGEIVAFQSLASILFGAEVSIFNSYTQYILASAFLTRVNDIWCEEEEDSYHRSLEVDLEANIKLKNLSFSYTKNSETVLHNINISIDSGKRVAFVGKSGSGKSSIGKIISGLYQVNDGMVYFDDIDMNKIKKSSICKQIGVVPQEVYLLNRSIKDNITMNDDSITVEEIVKVCKAVNIYDEIMAMPMGFNTIISEMGLNLSGGQRQRIALAKALIHKPKIVILDEATSALDSLNEKNITEYLNENGCTQIIIAHRFSTIIEADNIYVLNNGEIVEEGTHSELISLRGEYYKLYMTDTKNESKV